MPSHPISNQVRHAFTPAALLLAASLLPAALPVRAQQSTKYGQGALALNSSDANANSAFGYAALNVNTTGSFNTGSGYEALISNTTGSYNTAYGCQSLFYNNSGYQNTATGYQALVHNFSGYNNTANGFQALFSNSMGSDNTATGLNALFFNTTGGNNTACGNAALLSNTTGNANAGSGAQTLYSNTTGSYNTASGVNALFSNTTGYGNTASGVYALFNSTIGWYNIAVGYQAGQNITTGNNNIAIGNQGTSADNGVIRIGTKGTHTSAYIAGINGVTTSGGVAVYINSNGQLGTLTSSRRFKNDIKDMGDLSAKLLQLRPVTFKYKDSAESGPHHRQYGLIAEEVAKVCPDLMQYDKQGKPFTVYYHLLTPMLLNELQKAHRQIQDEHRHTAMLTATVTGQKSELASLRADQATQKTAHSAEVAALKAALQQQRSELAAVKQAQQQQLQMLARLNAALQANGKPAAQAAAYTR